MTPTAASTCGTMAYDRALGPPSVYRLDPDGRSPLSWRVTISNGLDWSPDGSVAYYIDPLHTRSLCSLSDKGLTERRTFDTDPGRSGWTRRSRGRRAGQGLGGSVWQERGAPVHRRGRPRRSGEVGARQVTACAVVAPIKSPLHHHLEENLDPGDDPLAGSLFTLVPGVTGLPVRAYAG